MIQLIVDYAKTRVSGDCMPLEVIKKPLSYMEKVFLTKKNRAKAIAYAHQTGHGFSPNKPMLIERYLYDEFDNTFPTGMLHRVIAALEKHQFLYEIHDLRAPTQSNIIFKPPTGKYADKKARPYQQDAIDTALFKKRGILRIACGGGKTLCAGEIIKSLGRRTVFLVNRGGLLYQAKEVFEEMLGGKHIGQVGDGVVDVQDVNVVMIQTLTKYLGKEYEIFDEEDTDEDTTDVQKYAKQIQEMLDSAELVFMDECHCIGAKTAFECLMAFKSAEWRIGLSVGGDSVVVIRDAKQQIKITTIKEIADKLNVGLDKIVMVEDGTQVRTYDGQKFVWRNLNAVHRYKCNKKVLEVTTDCGRKIRITEDHSVFKAFQNKHDSKRRIQLEVVRGNELVIGDYLLFDNSSGDNTAQSLTDSKENEGELTKIKEIIEVQESEVFDLSVDDTENFVANGILVHNSATPVREDGKDIYFEACFGPKLVNISFTYLIENGYLVRPYICFVKLNGCQLPHGTSARHSTIYSRAIVNHEFRNRMAILEAKSLYLSGHHPLMLVQHVKHGNILKSHMPEAGFIYGKDTIDQRKIALDKFCKGEIPILIATTILDEAIDIPPCDSIIMTGGGASYVRTIQRISRGMRIDPDNPNKKFCVVIDFFDQDKYLDRHCFVRQNTYRSEKAFQIILPGQPRPFDEDVF